MTRLIATTTLAVVAALLLSGCFFEVGSEYDFDYPIQSNGTVDMTLAPLQDIENFTLTGFYPPGAGEQSLSVYCEGQLVTLGPPGWWSVLDLDPIAGDGMFQISLDLTSESFDGCTAVFLGESVMQLALLVGGRYAPIMSEENWACMADETQSKGNHYTVATRNCIAADDRETVDPFGFNPYSESVFSADNAPREINMLRVFMPAN